MIEFKFAIKNPFCSQSESEAKHFINYIQMLTPNKSLEIEFLKWNSYYIFDLNANLNFDGSDHAGPEFSIEILGFYFSIKLFDHRHWNYEINNWENYEEENKMEKFTASLIQCKKYNIKYNDSLTAPSNWYVGSKKQLTPVSVGDWISLDDIGNTKVFSKNYTESFKD